MVSLHLDYTKYTLKSQVKTLCIFYYIIRILYIKNKFLHFGGKIKKF